MGGRKKQGEKGHDEKMGCRKMEKVACQDHRDLRSKKNTEGRKGDQGN